MKNIYFTITATHFFFGMDCFKPDMTVRLEKEPTNPHDSEAILVKLPGLGSVGYVANSTHTVLGESMSAGRLYDKIGDTATGIVRYVLPKGVVCELVEEEDGRVYGDGLSKNIGLIRGVE